MELTMTSILTGIAHTMHIPLDSEEFADCHDKWGNGILIQDAFPTLSIDEREFIKTGITPEEWEGAFHD